MAGSQHRGISLERVAKAAGIAVVAVIFGELCLDVIDSLITGEFGNVISLGQIRYAVLNEITTLAQIGSVVYVFARGTDADVVAKATGVVYAATLLQTIIFAIIGPSFSPGLGLLTAPLSAVLYFLGFVVAFHVVFETDVVSG